MDADFWRELVELNETDKSKMWEKVSQAIEDYLNQVHTLPILPAQKPQPLRELLKPYDFNRTFHPEQVLDFVVKGLTEHQLHFSNPGYMGNYVPRPTTMGIFADALASGFNSQLATWRASPFAIEMEQHVIQKFGEMFGYQAPITGTFTTGGSEANHTALLTAMNFHFPEIENTGLRGLKSQPIVYASAEAHHSIHKSIRSSGLGLDSLRLIRTNSKLQMDFDELTQQIQADRKAGHSPFLIVATAGTTNSGAIDPIERISNFCKQQMTDQKTGQKIWFHLDAAYGGAGRIVPEIEAELKGTETADSIAFDPHKMLCVPMGAGVFLTPHLDILKKTFRIDSPYISKSGQPSDVVEPYQSSLHLSRRFIGLKVFMSLAVIGWDGYRAAFTHQIKMANLLRSELQKAQWWIVNETALPVVCFVAPEPSFNTAENLARLAERVVQTGRFWISTTRLATGTTVLRAAIVNHQTDTKEVLNLVELLNNLKSQMQT